MKLIEKRFNAPSAKLDRTVFVSYIVKKIALSRHEKVKNTFIRWWCNRFNIFIILNVYIDM